MSSRCPYCPDDRVSKKISVLDRGLSRKVSNPTIQAIGLDSSNFNAFLEYFKFFFFFSFHGFFNYGMRETILGKNSYFNFSPKPLLLHRFHDKKGPLPTDVTDISLAVDNYRRNIKGQDVCRRHLTNLAEK